MRVAKAAEDIGFYYAANAADDWLVHSYQDFFTTKVDCWRVLVHLFLIFTALMVARLPRGSLSLKRSHLSPNSDSGRKNSFSRIIPTYS